jgi:hypothetical protein
MKAFPTSKDNGHSQNQDGMDLRDYFAAKAMQAIISNSDQKDLSIQEVNFWVSDYAYTVADSMMQARKTIMGD